MLPWAPKPRPGSPSPPAEASLPLFCAASFPKLFALDHVHYFSASQRLASGEDATHQLMTRTQFGWLREQDKAVLRCGLHPCALACLRRFCHRAVAHVFLRLRCSTWGCEAQELFRAALVDPSLCSRGLLVITMLRSDARAINTFLRSALPGHEFVFGAVDTGTPPAGVPDTCLLKVKQRVRVTFTQDGAPAGSLATVQAVNWSTKSGAALRDHSVVVMLDTGATVSITSRTFTNESASGAVIGSREAMPLEDGYATTVNSSQGCGAPFVYCFNSDGNGTAAWLQRMKADELGRRHAAAFGAAACTLTAEEIPPARGSSAATGGSAAASVGAAASLCASRGGTAGPAARRVVAASSGYSAAASLRAAASIGAGSGCGGGKGKQLWSAAGGWYTALTRGTQAARIYLHGFTHVVVSRLAVAFTLRIIQRSDPAEYSLLMTLHDEWLVEMGDQQRAAVAAAEASAYGVADAVLAAMGTTAGSTGDLCADALTAARYGWGATASAAALSLSDSLLDSLLTEKEGKSAALSAPMDRRLLRRQDPGAVLQATGVLSPEDEAAIRAFEEYEAAEEERECAAAAAAAAEELVAGAEAADLLLDDGFYGMGAEARDAAAAAGDSAILGLTASCSPELPGTSTTAISRSAEMSLDLTQLPLPAPASGIFSAGAGPGPAVASTRQELLLGQVPLRLRGADQQAAAVAALEGAHRSPSKRRRLEGPVEY